MAFNPNGTFTEFGNNLVIAKSSFKTNGIFTDENHLFRVFGDDIRKAHLGTLSLWNQQQWVSTPLIKMTELQKNVLYVNGDDGEFYFNMPFKPEGVSIKEDLTDPLDLTPGIDGNEFDILAGDGSSEPTFRVRDIITYDFRDGKKLNITKVGKKLGEGYVYTVRLVSNNARNEWFPKSKLAPGTQYFKVSNRIGEYDQIGSGITGSSGMMKLKHKLGSWRSVEHRITGSAQRLELPTFIDFERKYGRLAPLAPNDPNFAMAIMEKDKNGKADKSTLKWASMVEVMIVNELMRMEEQELMWSDPGELMGARGKKMYVGGGLYYQMKKGQRYSIGKYSRSVIIEAASQLFYARPDIDPKDRHFKFSGGRGAVMVFTQLFAEELTRTAAAFGGILNTDQLGVVKAVNGNPFNIQVGFRVSKVYIDGVGNFEIEYNPAFDAFIGRAADEPLIGGLPRYSYTSAIWDVTDGLNTNAAVPTGNVEFMNGANKNANIFMVRNKAMTAPKYTIVNGRTSPYGLYSGKYGVASSLEDGFTMFGESQSGIWLADPTRSVLIELF